MVPALFGVSAAQISLLINTQIASTMPTGTVSWLSYADRLMEFPTALLGVAAGTIILPSLVKHHADENPTAYAELLDWGLRLTVLLALPAALALGLLATPIVATVFHHGKFGADDVMATQAAVVAYSVGLLGLIVVKILAPAFYARQQIGVAVRCSVASLAATQICNAVLILGLRLPGHVALALSVGLGACVNAGLLFALLVVAALPAAAWLDPLPACRADVHARDGDRTVLKGENRSWVPEQPDARGMVARLDAYRSVDLLAFLRRLAAARLPQGSLTADGHHTERGICWPVSCAGADSSS